MQNDYQLEKKSRTIISAVTKLNYNSFQAAQLASSVEAFLKIYMRTYLCSFPSAKQAIRIQSNNDFNICSHLWIWVHKVKPSRVFVCLFKNILNAVPNDKKPTEELNKKVSVLGGVCGKVGSQGEQSSWKKTS